MEVNGQLHAPAQLPVWKKRPVPIEYGAGWAPEPMLKPIRTKKILSLPETVARFLPVAQLLYRLSYRDTTNTLHTTGSVLALNATLQGDKQPSPTFNVAYIRHKEGKQLTMSAWNISL